MLQALGSLLFLPYCQAPKLVGFGYKRQIQHTDQRRKIATGSKSFNEEPIGKAKNFDIFMHDERNLQNTSSNHGHIATQLYSSTPSSGRKAGATSNCEPTCVVLADGKTGQVCVRKEFSVRPFLTQPRKAVGTRCGSHEQMRRASWTSIRFGIFAPRTSNGLPLLMLAPYLQNDLRDNNCGFGRWRHVREKDIR